MIVCSLRKQEQRNERANEKQKKETQIEAAFKPGIKRLNVENISELFQPHQSAKEANRPWDYEWLVCTMYVYEVDATWKDRMMVFFWQTLFQLCDGFTGVVERPNNHLATVWKIDNGGEKEIKRMGKWKKTTIFCIQNMKIDDLGEN